eukprot:RCo046067
MDLSHGGPHQHTLAVMMLQTQEGQARAALARAAHSERAILLASAQPVTAGSAPPQSSGPVQAAPPSAIPTAAVRFHEEIQRRLWHFGELEDVARDYTAGEEAAEREKLLRQLHAACPS